MHKQPLYTKSVSGVSAKKKKKTGKMDVRALMQENGALLNMTSNEECD
jgi:hypothetical protein